MAHKEYDTKDSEYASITNENIIPFFIYFYMNLFEFKHSASEIYMTGII